MTEDLKIIKKLYGEAMMHFCRGSFSSILEESGKLPDILQKHFAPSHTLYEDLKNTDLLTDFKNYIYDIFDEKDEEIEMLDVPTPNELMRQAGYILYECKTENDIQVFKKYYAKGEKLCTFDGGRLNSCYVFFAVKENVDEIKRENFDNPKRQDEYGTSVISIQFSKDTYHTLSIKNRYNHTVINPDATFSNNLDNIITGLTVSFEQTYGMKQEHINDDFEIPGYVVANDGRFYKYNYEINNTYYCPDNIIIDNGEIKKYDKEKYIIIDYFILDLVEKRIYFYDDDIEDSFLEIIGKINKIIVTKKGKAKEVKIVNDQDEEIVITIDKTNEVIGLKSDDVKQTKDDFMYYNRSIMSLDLPNLCQVGNNFLCCNKYLTSLVLPNLQQAGDDFLYENRVFTDIDLPNLKRVGRNFLHYNSSLTLLSLPSLEQVGDNFMYHNDSLTSLELPNLKRVEDYFLISNKSLETLILPKLQQVGFYFLYSNCSLKILELPELQRAGDGFLFFNDSLKTLSLPNLQKVGNDFLKRNSSLITLEFPALQEAGKEFLANNKRKIGLVKTIQMRIRYEYFNILRNYMNIQTDEKGQGRK